jgi:ABC-type sugar transport system ATPase subunit
LRCIAGLEAPTSGAIRIAGEDKTYASPQQRSIGMCFQEATVYPHMSLRKNLAYPLKLARVDREQMDRRVDEMAKVLKLDPLLDKLPSQLSGGQRQRAALGRALIRKPSLFLLDEPMSSLDAKLKVEMRKELKSITTLFGTTTLYVTHDQEEAMALSDRICVMNKGRIEQFATPEEVYRAPKTVFVATFIGVPAMNMIECSFDNGQVTTVAGGRVLASGVKAGAGKGDRVTLGIRPEDVRIGVAGDGVAVEGEVLLAEVLGERTILYLKTPLGEIRATVYGISPHKAGERVPLGFNRTAIHLFDASGLRIQTH